ncbi:MGDG synthase family glycosyltransferase [Speluncibacter jeojiensis]|uniref:Diacylglycerol glucosyltransferase N-terminal domain-containing protein n=1 Tax=Speluncibacter jeojiensis TaxID=2710754 RepID=A0A9X4M4R9_9ACTN|nr:hypothetical protein [Corynebacteriales bacterium D3-21]
MSDDRFLLVTASMGAGHDQVAAELARRFEATGAHAQVVDLLSVLPWRIGTMISGGYARMLRYAPWLYEGIYSTFMAPRRGPRPTPAPLVRLAARRLAPILAEADPTCVVSTFHLAGQTVGHLRNTGRLGAPSVVAVTEVVPHQMWLARGTDLYCCLYPSIADAVTARTGTAAIAPGPVVDPRFLRAPGPEPGRTALGLAPGEDAVLISTGSWGVGDPVEIVATLARIERVRPVVLCGNNARLRERVASVPGALALGWRDDVPELLAAAAVVVDNAGGSMCMEAFASRVPVVGHRPIPGHGGPVVRALADDGLVRYAADDTALTAAVEALRQPGPERDALVRRAGSVFAEDPGVAITRWLRASVAH